MKTALRWDELEGWKAGIKQALRKNSTRFLGEKKIKNQYTKQKNYVPKNTI